eukprot:765503-Hanusia_phi.AAC.11
MSQDVSVHVSINDRMDFVGKNFEYKTLPFCELIKRSSLVLFFICAYMLVQGCPWLQRGWNADGDWLIAIFVR